MAQHATRSDNDTDEIFANLFDGFRDALSEFANLITSQQAARSDQRFTAFGDQLGANTQEVHALSEQLHQVMSEVAALKDQPTVGKVFQDAIGSLRGVFGKAFGLNQQATNEAASGTLTADTVDEFRSAMHQLTSDLAGVLTRIEQLEERAGKAELTLAGHGQRLDKHDDTLADHTTRIADLEGHDGGAGLEVIRDLLGYVPGDENYPGKAARLDGIEEAHKRLSKDVETIGRQANENSITLYGVAGGKPGLVNELEIDPNNGASKRLNQIETKIAALQENDKKRQQEITAIKSGISFGMAAALGAFAGAIVFLIAMVGFHAAFGTAVVWSLSIAGIVTGVIYANGGSALATSFKKGVERAKANSPSSTR